MKITRRLLLCIAFVLMSMSLIKVSVSKRVGNDVRWDIIRLELSTPPAPDFLPGGQVSARATDDSKITLSGSGTFDPEKPSTVTGGGVWQTFDSGDQPTGSGTYQVVDLISWHQAPGTPLSGYDHIGDLFEQLAGLAFLGVSYSDGERGVLVLGCHLLGTPESVFAGVTASKGSVYYWNREVGGPGAGTSRTLFHATRREVTATSTVAPTVTPTVSPTPTPTVTPTVTPTPPTDRCAGDHEVGQVNTLSADICAQSKAQAEALALADKKVQKDASDRGKFLCGRFDADCKKCELAQVTFVMTCAENADVKCKKGSGLSGFRCRGGVTKVNCRCKD